MPIKTFRGKLANDTQDTISLHTNDGSIGYRIVKFQVIAELPGSTSYEQVLKIYKTSQSTSTGKIDFSDQTLLGAAYLVGNSSSNYIDGVEIIFDNEIFNQDIYITQFSASSGSEGINYYIELEQVKLDLNANTVATLKNIRNITA